MAELEAVGSMVLKVEANKPPTLIWASLPNKMPLELSNQTWPLAWIRPCIFEPAGSLMRLITTDWLEGCTKLTVSPVPRLKLFQWMEVTELFCVTVVTV